MDLSVGLRIQFIAVDPRGLFCFTRLNFRRKYISYVLKAALSSLYLRQWYLTFDKHSWINDCVFQHLIISSLVHRTWQYQRLFAFYHVLVVLAQSSSWR